MNTPLVMQALAMIAPNAAWQVRAGDPPNYVDLNDGPTPSWEEVQAKFPDAERLLAERASAPEPEPTPQDITKLQRNLWLINKGLYNKAVTWINTRPEGIERLTAQAYWRDSEVTKFYDPITIALAEHLGLTTEEQRRQAFLEASQL